MLITFQYLFFLRYRPGFVKFGSFTCSFFRFGFESFDLTIGKEGTMVLVSGTGTEYTRLYCTKIALPTRHDSRFAQKEIFPHNTTKEGPVVSKRQSCSMMAAVMVRSTQWKRTSMTLTLAAGFMRPSCAFSTVSPAMIHSVLKNPSLLPNVSEEREDTFEVRNPANPDQIVAHVPRCTDVREAIDRSAAAFPDWRDKTTGKYRSSLLTEWSRLIQANADDIATIMTLESGKPLAESKGEVSYGTSFLDYYAAEAHRPTSAGGGMIIPTPFEKQDGSPKGHMMAIQQPVGVTGLITPWNFPIAMITRKVGPALAAGCTAVVKPAHLTPLTAIALETLAREAGIPADIFQLMYE